MAHKLMGGWTRAALPCEADQAEVLKRPLRVSNKSGVTGVHFSERKNKWVADICLKGRRKKASFCTKEEAIEQRIAWERQKDEGTLFEVD